MGATLDAIENETGPALTFAVAIEGWPDVLTDSGAPDAVYEAFQNSPHPGHTDYTAVLGGLVVDWDMRQSIDPWKPFPDPPALRFKVYPDIDSGGTGAITDRFGEEVARRTTGDSTYLDGDLDCNDGTITAKNTTDFASSGEVHLGPETSGYSGKTATTFTGATRGKYAPFSTSALARFSRTHKPIDATLAQGDATGVKLPPKVTEHARGLIGRWVGAWLMRTPTINGAAGTFDVPGDDAHLGYAGMVRGVEQAADGATVVTLEHALRKVYETTILRDQFKATVKDGFYLYAGVTFDLTTIRGSTVGNAGTLTVVASGAAGANQVNAGIYSAVDIASHLNTWLTSEADAGNILFQVTYDGVATNSNGERRGRIRYVDATAGSSSRTCRLFCSTVFPMRFLGWEDDAIGLVGVSGVTGYKDSPNAPRRFPPLGGQFLLGVTNVQGTYADQSTLLPSGLAVGDFEAVFQIGDVGHVRVKQLDATTYACTTDGMAAFFDGDGGDLQDALAGYTIADDVELTVRQVLVVQSTFSTLLLKVLLSTGTAGFNHATYDALPEQLGCAIPWSLFDNGTGDTIIEDLERLANADRGLCMIVDEPTRFVDLFVGQFQIRFAFLHWARGRIRLSSWTTPIAGYASLTLDEDNKAVPEERAASDDQRATVAEAFEWIANVIKVKAGITRNGDTIDTINVVHAASYRDHGERVRTIDLRNASARGPIADDVKALIADFSGALPMFSQPFWKVSRTISPAMFELAMMGATAALTDRHVRNPDTGQRYNPATASGGLAGWPVLVVSNRCSWGGPSEGDAGPRKLLGEVELMLLPRTVAAVYAPSATVDDTAATGGYVAGTKVLTCYAHKHSESSHAADATRFPVTSKVRVTQLDPDDPATALTWADVVAAQSGNTMTLTTGLAGWDATKRYRVTFDGYATCTATQQENAFQADDADGAVADLRQPYGLIYSGSGQLGAYTGADQEVAPALYAEELIGDGVALCCGGDKDIAELCNEMVGYKQALQAPIVLPDVLTFGGAGTWEMKLAIPLPVQSGRLPPNVTRKLYVSPQAASSSGSSSVRITIGRFWPADTTRDDVTFAEPYVQATFTTASATQAILTEQGIDLRHLDLGDGTFSGVAWLFVELTANAQLAGLAHIDLGPVEAA